MFLQHFTTVRVVALLGCLFVENAESAAISARRSPQYQHSFQFPLPIPIVKKPLATYKDLKTGTPIDYYEIEAKEFTRKLYPNLEPAKLFGYDGSFPGPTFRVERGTQTVVRVVNKGQKAMNAHLHGSFSRAPWDGWAMDMLNPGQFKDYYFPNSVNARTLWYHDHTNRQSAVNAYRGLFGMYNIVDSKLDSSLGLPSGDKYDVPLILSAHYFTAKGDLSDEAKERNSIYGDTWLVNGQIQPFLQVEPRKYRFRVVNAAVSRTFNLTVLDGTTTIPMSVIGSDGGLRQSPAQTKSLVTGMAERWEVVIDFASFAGKTLTMHTANMWTDKAFENSDEVMQFKVGPSVTDTTNNGPLPQRFALDIKFPSRNIASVRNFTMVSHMDMMWGINNYHMDNPMTRVLMRPPLGTIEKFRFRSSGMGMGGMMGGGGMSSGKSGSGAGGKSSSSSGMNMGGNMGGMHGASSTSGMSGMHGATTPKSTSVPENGMGGSGSHHSGGMMGMIRRWLQRRGFEDTTKLEKRQSMMGGMSMGATSWTHAIHLHMVDFQVVSRSKDNATKAEGRGQLENYETGSVKDVVVFGSNEVVEVLAKFQPYPGVYMWHCHNAVHEDQGMMAVMNITRLPDFGNKELETPLEDPMETRFLPKPYKGTDLGQVKSVLLPFFASLNAYPDLASLNTLEEKYWADRAKPSAADTGPKMSGQVGSGLPDGHSSHHGGGGMKGM